MRRRGRENGRGPYLAVTQGFGHGRSAKTIPDGVVNAVVNGNSAFHGDANQLV
jgi:hypothetical protein